MRKGIIIGGIAAAVVLVGIVGAVSGGGSKSEASAPTTSAAPVTVTEIKTVPGKPSSQPTVTVTAPAPAPVTVTATAAPAAPAVPAATPNTPEKSKADGKFLVGSQIAPGTWQCSKAGSFGSGENKVEMAYWEVDDQTGDIMSNGNDTIAIIADDGYTVKLDGCATFWDKV